METKVKYFIPLYPTSIQIELTTNNMTREAARRTHNHHKDQSEIFKEQQLRAIRRRRVFEKALFTISCIVAIVIILFVCWIYTN